MNAESNRCQVAAVADLITKLEAEQRIADETFNRDENDRLNDALSCLRDAATHLVPQSADGMRFLVDLIGLYSEFADSDEDDESRVAAWSAVRRMTDSVARLAC